jgi:hypothetical protein
MNVLLSECVHRTGLLLPPPTTWVLCCHRLESSRHTVPQHVSTFTASRQGNIRSTPQGTTCSQSAAPGYSTGSQTCSLQLCVTGRHTCSTRGATQLKGCHKAAQQPQICHTAVLLCLLSAVFMHAT